MTLAEGLIAQGAQDRQAGGDDPLIDRVRSLTSKSAGLK
jgi:hypothetical protein